MPTYHIHPDIRQAETLPASFYRDAQVFELLRERVFVPSWQWIGDTSLVPLPQQLHPFVLLDGFLSEPMLLTRDAQDQLHCLSNVCTHRGNLLAHHPGKAAGLRCLYHGRRFQLNGRFESMPEFGQAQNFPRPCDHLHRFELQQWGPFLFVSMQPAFDFKAVISRMNERIGFLPLHEFRYHSTGSKDYLVHAHWALYCDNYLEGFHIPFVHKDLNDALDYGQYTTEIYEYCNLQIGYADGAEAVFDLPPGHIDYGRQVAAYYYWVFPNMMFNFYPWGLSVNVVRPLAPNRSRVSFLTYVYDESKMDSGAGARLDKVEREDEFVVEGVQKGMMSRYYRTGRFSPVREQGVHYFHRLLAKALNA
ncbi:MAG: aromatic ring-hydroxylating dioxygenase subunit alpha [Bacteroidetes bacterium]|nr:MAG: aromatic ring-hydroxylating dioxygenase subunit alpha [Bacteroidota bacterium]